MLPSKMTKASPFVWLALAGACLALACSLAACSGNHQAESSSAEASPLFDFSNYQQAFAKRYGSHIETITRRAYYMANAFKVYLSGVAYKFRKQNHYEAVNEYSDFSPRELEAMENKVLEGAGGLFDEEAAEEIALEPSKLKDEEEYSELVEDELEKKIGEVMSEAKQRHLLPEGPHSRRKREADPQNPRDFSFDQLVKSNEPVRESPEVLARWDRNPKSDNPNYDPLQLEIVTMGLSDQQEELSRWQLRLLPEEKRALEARERRQKTGARAEHPRSFLKAAIRSLSIMDDEFQDARPYFEPDDAQLPDRMFADLRQTGCLFQPRAQGQCGSCYAFAGIALAEYLYCAKTGRLVAFSEQYMVDCGKGRYEMMDGCSGGIPYNMPKFIHNFGLELRQHYPYYAREHQCPYDESTDLKATGFIRLELGHMLKVPVATWERVLKFSPIYVSVSVPKGFSHYGGGVYDGQTCRENANHGMVVVGHGREDGQEFWLVRNSYGPNWGDKGHWKLSKAAPDRCVEHQVGYIYGSNDGESFQVKPKVNYQNEPVMFKKLKPLTMTTPRPDMVVQRS